jgi:hypothetical protein
MPHLFYPTKNSSVLRHEVVKERFYIQEPCFMDNTNLISTKKRNFLENTLVAIQHKGIWQLASLVKLVYGKALVFTCCYDKESSRYLFDATVPILISDSDTDTSLRYLDLLLPQDLSNSCILDGMAQVHTYGPNKCVPPSTLLDEKKHLIPSPKDCYTIEKHPPKILNNMWKVFRKIQLCWIP